MSKRFLLASVGPAMAGLAISAVIWAEVPNPMPIHWDAAGDPNGWAPRAMGLLMMPLIGMGASAVTGWGMRRGRLTDGALTSAMLGIGGFLLGIHALMVHAALHPAATISMTGVVILTGALFGGLGLLMPQLKQNRWAGVRTPWTLGDEVNWTLTHRFAGWTMGISGVVCMIAGAVLSPPVSFRIGMAAVLVGSLLPLGYSYVIHRMRRR